jgi:uncharacterized membrane protein YkvI
VVPSLYRKFLVNTKCSQVSPLLQLRVPPGGDNEKLSAAEHLYTVRHLLTSVVVSSPVLMALYLFLVHLTSLHQLTKQRQIIGLNNKPERIWKEAAMIYTGMNLEGLRTSTKSFNKDSQSPSTDLNAGPPEC